MLRCHEVPFETRRWVKMSSHPTHDVIVQQSAVDRLGPWHFLGQSDMPESVVDGTPSMPRVPESCTPALTTQCRRVPTVSTTPKWPRRLDLPKESYRTPWSTAVSGSSRRTDLCPQFADGSNLTVDRCFPAAVASAPSPSTQNSSRRSRITLTYTFRSRLF